MSLFGSAGGNTRNTGRGGYHPGVGPQDIDRPVTTSTGTPLVQPFSGLELRINPTRDEWSSYATLPTYLLGPDKFTSTVINETDSGTFTITRPCRVWLMRRSVWNAVDLTGWTLHLAGQTIISIANDANQIDVYYKDFTAGTYAYDNNSALYIWDFDETYSQPAGTVNNLWLSGSGATTATTSSFNHAISRYALDPFGSGNVTYSLASGSLPPGFTLDANTGLISGKYTVAGINTDGTAYTFTIRATDATSLNFTDRTYTINLTVPWLYRQIITTCYTVGGYKDSQLWNNGNKFPRATETCTNMGDGVVDNFHYKGGMCDNDKGYVFGGGTVFAVSAGCTAFNMRTESKITAPTAPGVWGNVGFTFSPDRNRAFLGGDGPGTGAFYKFTASTTSFTNLGGGWAGGGNGTSAISGENKGLYWGDAARRMTFDTESLATITYSAGVHGQQKGLSAKTGFGYCGNEGSFDGGNNLRKVNISAETSITMGKPGGANTGEENWAMSQDNGYMLGNYNGSISGQNNICGRVVYATNAVATLATTLQGKPGASSGHTFWRD